MEGTESGLAALERPVGWPVIAGTAGAALLAALYVAIVGLAQDFGHAFQLLADDWYFVVPIVIGFGTQVGLFVRSRAVLRLHAGRGASAALTGAGTGTSTASMVACCAHHLTDVLPVLGLSGAALFLNDYRTPLMLAGIATNALGIVLMVRLLRRSAHSSCPMGA